MFSIGLLTQLTLLCCSLIVASSERYASQTEYELPREKFATLPLNTTQLFGYNGIENTDKNVRYTYMVMPKDEASLPSNWNHIVIEKQKLIIIYGYPSKMEQLLDLELSRIDEFVSEISRAKVKILLTDKRGFERVGNESDLEKSKLLFRTEDEVELAFQRISLDKFLFNNYASKIDSMFNGLIWPRSRLISVAESSPNTNETVVKIRNNHNEPSIERLSKEVDRATRGGLKKLCQFQKSKAISVEHLFRSIGLYPNWCSFKLISRVEAI